MSIRDPPPLQRSTFEDNSAKASSDHAGGAVYASAASAGIMVTACAFMRNSAAGKSADGGALVFLDSDTTIENTHFSDNYAYNQGAHVWAGAADENDAGDYTLTVSGSTFRDGSTYSGAAGAVYSEYMQLRVSDSTFEGNSADTYGGAIAAECNDVSSFEITGCYFGTNTATLSTNGAGGAIFFEKGISASIDDCIFDENESTKGKGGAVSALTTPLTVSSSHFSHCSADGNGGSIFTTASSTSNAGTYFVNIVDSVFVESSSSSSGGAVYNEYANLNMSNCSVHDSYATGYAGAVESYDGEFESSVTFSNCSFRGNSADNKKDGGMIYVYRAGQTTIAGTSFVDGEMSGSGADGGCVYIARGDVSVSDSTFESCSAPDDGGALYLEGGTSSSYAGKFSAGLHNVHFSGSSAGDTGASLFSSYYTLTASGCKFHSSTASSGGGVYVKGSGGAKVTFSDSTFSANSVSSDGGAMYLYKADTTVDYSYFWSNSASDSGDDAYLYNADLAVYCSEGLSEDGVYEKGTCVYESYSYCYNE